MTLPQAERRLAAILVADVVGYSRLVEADEAGTLAAIRDLRDRLLRPLMAEHHGRIAKLLGDGLIAEFGSIVEAVACAAAVQTQVTAWQEKVTSERRIALRIGVKLDVRFEYAGEQRLKNITRPVRAYRMLLAGSPSALPSSLRPDRRIAVLPFESMSSDPKLAHFADGLTEDITTQLSRDTTFSVIARTFTLTYKGQPTDVKRIAQELGVRFVLAGSARRARDRLRVSAQLVDATSGHNVWTEQYDDADSCDFHDEITGSVVAEVLTQLHLAAAEDLVSQAMRRLHDLTLKAFAEVADLAAQAIRLDPTNARAHTMRAAAFLHRLCFGEITHDANNVERGLELARHAVGLDPRDPYSHWIMAFAYAEAGDLDKAIFECEVGLEINPNWMPLLADMGDYLAFRGQPKKALKKCRKALRRSRRDPSNFWRHSSIATVHFVVKRNTRALKSAKKVDQLHPEFPRGPILWAAAAAALHRMDKAKAAVACCLARWPRMRVTNVVPDFIMRFARPKDTDRLLDLLRKAGLPE